MSDDGGIQIEIPLIPTEEQLREMRKENMKDRTEALNNPETWCYLKGWSKVDLVVSENDSFSGALNSQKDILVSSLNNQALTSFQLLQETDDEAIYKASALIGLSPADINNPDDKPYINRSRYVKITESLK